MDGYGVIGGDPLVRPRRDERPAYQSVWVENNDDGFRMRIEANDVGGLYLVATSSCVWPDGTPESA